MKVVWLPRAVADLQHARAHIAKHNPHAAHAVAQRIRKTVAHLTAHPQLGRLVDVGEIRQMSVPGLPYLIPYRVKDNRIEILRVFHTAQEQPDNWER
jgi:toxin ParE1/3/4